MYATVFFLKITWPSGGQPLQMPQSPCSVKTKSLLSRGVNMRQIWPAKAQHHQVNYSKHQKKPDDKHLNRGKVIYEIERTMIGCSSLDRIETKSAGVALLFSTEIASMYICAGSHRCTPSHRRRHRHTHTHTHTRDTHTHTATCVSLVNCFSSLFSVRMAVID